MMGNYKGFNSWFFLRNGWLCILLILILSSCAPRTAQMKDKAVQTSEIGKIKIERIDVEKIEKGNEVTIRGSLPLSYAAFKLDDPLRLIIDIPDADFGTLQGSKEINNGIIKRITTKLYGEESRPIGRIAIEMEEGVEYKLNLKVSTLSVKFEKEDSVPPSQDIPESEETLSLEEELLSTQKIELTQEAEKEFEDVKAAMKLLSIDVNKEERFTKVFLKTDGVVRSFNSFGLDDPKRVVIDLLDINSTLSDRVMPLDAPYVEMVRIGTHPDKTRVVLDLKEIESIPYSVERVETGLLVTLSQESPRAVPQDLSQAVLQDSPKVVRQDLPQAVEQGSQQITGPGMVEIMDVDFEDAKDVSKVTVTASQKIDYDVTKSFDGKTLALVIKGAFLPNHLQRSLDTSELKSPVLRVSSYMIGKKTDNRVMVVVRLKEKVPYEISQKNNLLTIDFHEVQIGKVEDITKVARAEDSTKVVKAETPRQKTEQESTPSKVKEGTVPGSLRIEEGGLRQKPPTSNLQPPTKYVESGLSPKSPEVVVATEKKYTGRELSLDFKDADIRNILRLIAEVSNLNIVAGEDVKGKVTLRLIDVPWDQALEIILKSRELGMMREGNVIRIAPFEKIAREKARLLADKKAEEKLEDLEIKIIPVNYADAGDLKDKVKGLLSERGSVTVDDRTNAMIIKDLKANIEEAESLVKELDAPTPQVLIEARIVEANSNFARDLGVNWGIDTGAAGSDTSFSVFGSTGTSGLTPPQPSGATGTTNFAVSLPATGQVGILGALGFTFGKISGDPFFLDLKLSAGEKAGLTKTISRPRIATLDNKEAVISQGESIPFETVSEGGTQTEFIDATLELRVTPHVTQDGSIFMKIKVSRNSIGTFTSAITGTPSISKKEASTEMLVKDGETAVIGGIIVSDKSDSSAGIPYFSKIPIFGWFFKRESVSNTQTELLIFITPTILKGKTAG